MTSPNGHHDTREPLIVNDHVVMIDTEGCLWAGDTRLDAADWDDESRDRHAAALRWWMLHQDD